MVEAGGLAFHLGLGLLASVLLAGGLLVMKSRASSLPAASGAAIFRAIGSWVRDPRWTAALAIQAAGYALYIVALSAAPVSLVAVMMQAGVAMFVIFAVLFLHERASRCEWLGIAGVAAAAILLALSLEAGARQGRATAPALFALAAAASAAAALPGAMPRLRASGVATAIASGVAFGLGSVFTKAMADGLFGPGAGGVIGRALADQWLYWSIAANVTGLVLLQNSFHATRGIVAMPLSSAISNMIPIAGGMAVFGESLPAEPLAASLRIAAFALTIGSSGLLAAAARDS